MSEINHICLIEVLNVAIYYTVIFYQNWTSTDSFLNVPFCALFWIDDWSGDRIWEWKFVCLKIVSIRINVLCCKFSSIRKAKRPNCGMVAPFLVNRIFGFHSAIFCQKWSWKIIHHVEIASVEDCIHHILFWNYNKSTFQSILNRCFRVISQGISICILNNKF